MNLNKKAILFGASLDLGLSAFFSQILYALLGYWLIAKGIPTNKVIVSANSYSLFYYLLIGIGLNFDIIGGYTAAKIANQNHIAHSAAAAIPILIFNAINYFSPWGAHSLLSLLFCLPAFIYGGWSALNLTHQSS
jgi:hypothetical protein